MLEPVDIEVGKYYKLTMAGSILGSNWHKWVHVSAIKQHDNYARMFTCHGILTDRIRKERIVCIGYYWEDRFNWSRFSERIIGAAEVTKEEWEKGVDSREREGFLTYD